MTAPVVREHVQDLSLGRVRWLEAGEGTPVVLLHGMGLYSSASLFEFIIPALAQRLRVLAPDVLGFGKGARQLKEGPTFELILEHLREFMDVLDVPRAHLVGHSMGGWISALFAYQSPSRVDRLVMLCAAGLNRAPAQGIRFPEVPGTSQLRAMFQASLLHPDAADPAVIDQAAETAHEMSSRPGALAGLEPLLHQMETASLRPRYLLHRRLAHISAPTLMAWGEGDVHEPFPTWNAEWEAAGGDMLRSSKPWVVPGACLARLPTGHYPHLERPAQTARLILDFLCS